MFSAHKRRKPSVAEARVAFEMFKEFDDKFEVVKKELKRHTREIYFGSNGECKGKLASIKMTKYCVHWTRDSLVDDFLDVVDALRSSSKDEGEANIVCEESLPAWL